MPMKNTDLDKLDFVYALIFLALLCIFFIIFFPEQAAALV